MSLRQYPPDSLNRKTVITLQWLVVIGTSYFSLLQKGEVVEDPRVLFLVVTLLLSALAFYHVPDAVIAWRYFPHFMVIVDTILVGIGIGLNQETPWDLFLLFFFGLFIAGIGETLTQIVMGCLVLSVLSVLVRPLAQMNLLQMDPDLLKRIPFLFGISILYAFLAEQVKREKKRADERQTTLHEVNKAITSSLDLQSILELLVEKIALLLPYSGATVKLLNGETGLLELVASRNVNESEWNAVHSAESIPAEVFERSGPSMTMMTSEPPSEPTAVETTGERGSLSYLGVPLIAKGAILGVLGFYTRGKREFSKEEIEFLTTLAGQAAVAIQNAQLYKETKDMAADLAAALKAKDEFLSVMSHELRTPLTAVLGYADMMRDGMLGETNLEQNEALEKVLGQSRHLLNTIGSILETTSIEAKAMKVEIHRFSLPDFLDDIKSIFDVPTNKDLAIKWDYAANLPVMNTDRDKLRHILQNLISNAIKFTDRGFVKVSVGYNPKSQMVEFKVVDTGIGIPQESLPIIFEKFRQIDSSETRTYGGVGLGLYIVKKFTVMLGGEVSVHSQPGEGSTFSVCIPIHGTDSELGGVYEKTDTVSRRSRTNE